MELSSYCSELIKNKIFPAFALQLKTSSATKSCILSINMICEHLKKDFLNIEPSEAQDFFSLLQSGILSSKKGTPFSQKTIYMRYSCVRSLSSYIQVNQDLFGIKYSSPFIYLELSEPGQHISTEHILTSEEINTLLKSAKDLQMYLMLSLVLTCGLSVKELIELKPSQLILDEKNRLSISFLKNDGGEYRYIKVPSSLQEALLLHADSVKAYSSTVFNNKRGKPYSMRLLELHIQELMEGVGLKGWTLRDLRNTAAFYMLSGGANHAQTATQLGICERWMYRFNKVVEEMDIQASDYSCIQIRSPKF